MRDAKAWRGVWRALGLAGLLAVAGVAMGGEPLRGMTVTCFRWGPGEWDGPTMGPTLDRLAELGVNAVTTHPYARIRSDGAVLHQPAVQDASSLVPMRLAAERGQVYLLKPHLAYWGSRFAWRGEITFDGEADWARFFDGYRDFIVHHARLAEAGGAAWFAVGTELEGTTHRPEWGPILDEVRAVYSGRLTYAANWDTLDRVPFWDRLDAVGVQFYYPLTDAADPTDAQLRRAVEARLDEAVAFARGHGKPMMLTELGYAPHDTAASRPWDDAGDETERGFVLSRRCLDAALRAVMARDDSDVVGVYLWKWFPTPREFRDEFALQYPEAIGLISERWSRPTE
ncbi:MAG: hypothetical protein AAF078_04795 [Planctomycetota bacterium]